MEMMNIDSIKTDNKYLRLETNVDKLMKSIETVGLINPLIINKDDELIAGGRRFMAMKTLGYSEVPVFKVQKDKLEQELISIDENLVRLDLKNMEFEQSLSRGKEIYETIYPQATKFEEEDLTLPEANEVKSDLPNEQRSFIDLTAEKTGLSKRVIKSAIEREQRSSDSIKKLRSNGDLNATQTNEVIKLSKDEQEQVADIITGKSGKEIKNFVKDIQQKGLDTAIDDAIHAPVLPKEYKSLSTLLKRVNKNINKIILEEMTSDHEEVAKINKLANSVRMSLEGFLALSEGETEQAQSDYNYQEMVGDSHFQNNQEAQLNSGAEL